ncbi:hypothetical protein MGN70_002335 [Eutypa lata]|nr:hypothetical protein MGN70_002335 [Eutypa lata]
MVPTSGAVDLQPLFLHYTLDTATYFIFGRSTDALSGNDSDAYDEFRKAFSFILEQTGHPSQTLPLRSGTQIKMAEEFRTCRDYIERSTEEALSLHGCPRGEFTSDDEEKLSSSWSSLSAQQEGSQERNSDSLVGKLACLSSDKETLHYELLNLLISTRDSIANLLSSLFIEIVRRPDVWAKLRDEVGQVKGQEPDYEQLRDLKYARSCVNEALRLHPPVLSNTRIAVRDTVLPRALLPCIGARTCSAKMLLSFAQNGGFTAVSDGSTSLLVVVRISALGNNMPLRRLH